jgi:trimethylamine--corrinoid protein Co-methyltransferase
MQMTTTRTGVSGGHYKPLTDEEIERIHETSMRVFEDVGLEVNNKAAQHLFQEAGARVKGDRVTVPHDLVMELVGRAPSAVNLHGRDARYDLTLEQKKVHLGTGGTALNMLDIHTAQKRPATVRDMAELARLCDALDHIHFFMLPIYPDGVPQAEADVNRFVPALLNTTKHVMGGVYSVEGIRKVVKIAELMAGSLEALRERPFISMVTCMISPLRLDRHYSDLLMEVARLGIPLVTPTEPLCGSTAPVTLAGNLVVQNVETLTGVMLAQLVNPGTPVLYGCISSTVNLRDMRYLSGSVEMGLLSAGAAQLAQRYQLPIYATAGMSDSKVPDAQAGYEKMATTMLVAMAGANLIHDAAGFLEFCMTASLEQCVIDDEINGMVMRAVEGVQVDEDALAYDAIRSVGPGGHFTADPHTVEHMRGEFYFPQLSDRELRENWESAGALDTWQRARGRALAILEDHTPDPLPDSVVEQIYALVPELQYQPVPAV